MQVSHVHRWYCHRLPPDRFGYDQLLCGMPDRSRSPTFRQLLPLRCAIWLWFLRPGRARARPAGSMRRCGAPTSTRTTRLKRGIAAGAPIASARWIRSPATPASRTRTEPPASCWGCYGTLWAPRASRPCCAPRAPPMRWRSQESRSQVQCAVGGWSPPEVGASSGDTTTRPTQRLRGEAPCHDDLQLRA